MLYIYTCNLRRSNKKNLLVSVLGLVENVLPTTTVNLVNLFLYLRDNQVFFILLLTVRIMSPLRRGGGHIVFGVDPVGVVGGVGVVGVGGVAFLSARYLLNHWMDLDQTGTETSLGQPNRVIRFW